MATDVPEEELALLPALYGSPFIPSAFPITSARVAGVVDSGSDVVLNGEGGEPVFAASPVAVWDMVRSGRFRDAMAATLGFSERWIYPTPKVAKAAIRAVLPPRLLSVRERARSVPPWTLPGVRHRLDPVTAPRDSHEHLVTALACLGSETDSSMMNAPTAAPVSPMPHLSSICESCGSGCQHPFSCVLRSRSPSLFSRGRSSAPGRGHEPRRTSRHTSGLMLRR